MSKNYHEISNQVAAIQMDDRTVSFYANLEPVPKESFMELINGKIKVSINDFSSGKGDSAVWAAYNLDLRDIKYLYQRAKLSHMPIPFQGKKIHGSYPITEGEYKGYCKSYHITITHSPVRKDHSVSKCPWNITISNGVAKIKPGKYKNSYYEDGTTYRQLSYAYVNLTTIDFFDCMEKIYTYINLYRSFVSKSLIPEGLQALQKARERNKYMGSLPKQGGNTGQMSPPSTQQTPVQQTPVRQTSMQQTPVKPAWAQQMPAEQAQAPQIQAQPASQAEPELHPTTLLIHSDFVALSGGMCLANCLVKGKTYPIYFDTICDELIEAQTRQIPITVNLYQDSQKRFRCTGLAS